jgi:hypothetical protein
MAGHAPLPLAVSPVDWSIEPLSLLASPPPPLLSCAASINIICIHWPVSVNSAPQFAEHLAGQGNTTKYLLSSAAAI